MLFVPGKKEVLMSVKDFYNAVTPGSSVTHGVGRGVYTILRNDDVCSTGTYETEKLPIDYNDGHSLLNEASNYTIHHSSIFNLNQFQ